MDEDYSMECDVCGGTDFHKAAGHFYCNECQTQSQQVKDHVFEQDDDTVNKKGTRKIQKEKTEKVEDTLTSWECYNYVMKGLTAELVALGARPELTDVVRCLWMKYLHMCEVFDITSDQPPKVSVLGPKKDVAILYNVKKRKRPRSKASSTSTTLSARRKQSTKKRALIKSQYEELSQTQNTSVMNDTLSSLQSGSEASESNCKIIYNRFSNSELKRLMSSEHHQEHLNDMEGELTCHKLKSRSFRPNFTTGPTNLTTFTPYCILYLGLLITRDPIQLGDMLRFIREGHLSLGCYKHFFDECLSGKALNISQRKEKLFSHSIFRKRCAKMAQFLDVTGYIDSPDVIALCARYCAELNLPREVFECVEKFIVKSCPKLTFNETSKVIPNYEARAMAFIVFSLKLLFGLDGMTEIKFSKYAQAVKMFDIMQWLQFIAYRRLIMTIYHLPSTLKDCNSVNSDQYLSYLENQKVNFKGTSRHIHGEVKDYLQVLEKLIQSSNKDIVFKPSLTPYVTYTKDILDVKRVGCPDILRKTFQNCSLSFLLHPNAYLKLLGVTRIKNGGANDNVVTEDLLYLYRNTVSARIKGSRPVSVKISDRITEDKFIDEYLTSIKRKSLKTTDIEDFLSNWHKSNQKKFLVNKDLLKVASENTTVGGESLAVKSVIEAYNEHYNPFERYWLNVPMNPNAHYFPKHEMDVILAKFPHSLKTIMDECSRILEQDLSEFYSEFLMTELYLVNFEEFGCKTKKLKSKEAPEMRPMLENCKKHW